MNLFLIQLFGYDLTAIKLLAGAVALLYGLAKVFQAVRDIRTLGWQPFKDHWIAPRQARTKKLDELIGKFDEFQVKTDSSLDSIGRELRTNGGSSLKDMVTSIDAGMQKLQTRIDIQDELSPQAIFHLNPNGQMCMANAAFREMVDSEEKDLFYSNYLSRIEDSDSRALEQKITYAISKNMPFDAVVRFKVHGSNETIKVRLQANPSVKSGGTLLGYVGTALIVQDVAV